MLRNIVRKGVTAVIDIGDKVKRLRLKLGLTQEELAARTELSKGFISQLERNLTSPSISTLMDILEALGTDIASFFANDGVNEKVIFSPDDMFENADEELGVNICWLVPNAQKNALEPILVTLSENGSSVPDDPHDGEEFGYVIEGEITIRLGKKKIPVRKGESFYFIPSARHYVRSDTGAVLIWVSTPPSF